MAFEQPSRPLGLIAIVVLVDLVLAGSGAFMLAKGLSKPAAASAPAKATMGSAAPKQPTVLAPVAITPTETVDAAVAGQPVAAGSDGSAAPGNGSQTADQSEPDKSGDGDKPPAGDKAPDKTGDKPPPADRTKKTTKSGGKTKTTTKSSGPVTSPSGPVTSPSGDTGGGASIEAQIEARAKASQTAFDNCRRDAGGPVHGEIEIAFRVMGDGKVANVSVVKNQTNNTELARCLLGKIQKWKVTAHGGAPMPFVRPFNYP